MRIHYTIADLQPESGGPSRSVSALAAAVAELGVEVSLQALEYGRGRIAPMIPQKNVHTTLVSCRGMFAKKFRSSPGFKAALQKNCVGTKPILLHDNGLWLPTNHTAARVAREMKIPLIISPRGMLTPWAMRFHGLKKRIAWLLYQYRDLQSAQVLHATSHQEAEEFRTLRLTQPIAVIPNGVSLPPEVEKPETVSHASRFTPQSRIRTALFLSRIHPKKGLLDLVEAWHHVKPVGWRVVVAGGEESGHLSDVKAAISKLKLENEFTFIGQVEDESKWDLYRSADLFVLPTKSENFGIVIAEALACSLPVITTRGTPWEELRQWQCGWWVEIGVRPLADALTEAVRLSDEERHAMGQRGRKLVEENYAWPGAAKRLVAVYEWLLGGRPKPECVIVI